MKTLVQEMTEMPDVVSGRMEIYGSPDENFTRGDTIMRVLDEIPDKELRYAAQMIGVKLARLVQSPDHQDTWCDIVGYALTAGHIIDNRNATNY